MPTILACGGRDYRNPQHLSQVLSDVVAEYVMQGEPAKLIHGGARGADTMAGQWAASNNIEVQVFPANWDRDGRAAGPIRNSQMLAEGKPDVVVAFPGGKGTADMIAKARRAGVPVREIVRL